MEGPWHPTPHALPSKVMELAWARRPILNFTTIDNDSSALWLERHPSTLTVKPDTAPAAVLAFLRNPPLPIAVRLPYLVLLRAAAATVPPRLAAIV